ncbi:DNA mismatch repair endonuclease MutL [uncultured Succinatimonas sp.]|uniref:DNA mismatch repair endonuclease MutL n=1 Tax=uncultured Succinatimonas sp. TaxID=1262973 RepID=UPI0025F0BE28|nr:DNA mismatch repair endonuclease MutL [uncultured Succinatimonas sp.]
MPIRRLSVQLANQIAAGEVVERPSSVVKELLENAVDAKATKIVCDLKNSGKSLIRVRDNGQGISHEELPLALAPHATSKIATLEDLEAILTLGFRGEALASIAAVSKLTLTSRTKDEDHAYSVEVEGPQQNPEINPAAHPVGTSVEVCELFFNTPARRRFLRSDRTEFMHIREIFVRTALANPDIDFELNLDGKNVINVKAVMGDEKKRLVRLSKLAGSDFNRSGIFVKGEDPCLNVNGVLLPPSSVEESAVENIFLFLNGRPIADKVLTHALKQAYSEVAGRPCPVRCVLYLTCDPHEVDINVHPRKDEVRFHEARLVHDVLLETVVNSLRKALRDTDDLLKEDAENEKTLLEDKTHSDEDNSLNQFLKDIKSVPSLKSGSSYKSGGSDQSSFVTSNHDSLSSTANRGGINYSPHYIQMPSSKDGVKENLRRYDYQIAADNARSRAGIYDVKRVDLTSPKAAKLLSLPAPDVLFIMQENRYFLVKASVLNRELVSRDYMAKVKLGTVEVYALSMPFVLKAQKPLINAIKACPEALARAGFTLNLKKESIEFLKIPVLLQGVDLAGILVKALPLAAASAKNLSMGICPKQLADMFAAAKKSVVYYKDEAQLLVDKISDPEILESLGSDAFELNIARWARELGGAGNA